MKVPVSSYGKIHRIILVVCPNRYNLHDKVYVRYMILLDDKNPAHAIFVDDPSEEEAVALLQHIIDGSGEVVKAECPWCIARGENPYDT